MLHLKFYKILCNKGRNTKIIRILEKKDSNASTNIHNAYASLLFLMIYILHIIFCAILFSRSRDITILRTLEKTQLEHLSASYTHKNYANVIS